MILLSHVLYIPCENARTFRFHCVCVCLCFSFTFFSIWLTCMQIFSPTFLNCCAKRIFFSLRHTYTKHVLNPLFPLTSIIPLHYIHILFHRVNICLAKKLAENALFLWMHTIIFCAHIVEEKKNNVLHIYNNMAVNRSIVRRMVKIVHFSLHHFTFTLVFRCIYRCTEWRRKMKKRNKDGEKTTHKKLWAPQKRKNISLFIFRTLFPTNVVEN